MKDTRIRIEKTPSGQYEAYLQFKSFDGYSDVPYRSYGIGNSVSGAIANLRDEIESDIIGLKMELNNTYTCDVVDSKGKIVSRGFNLTLKELLES